MSKPPRGESGTRTAGIRRRDPEVLDAVARECLPGLLRAARAAGLTPEQAEDIVQSSFLVFLRRAEEFDGRARVMTWLYGIMLRKISETRRSSSSRDEPTDDIDAVVDARFGADGRWTRPPGPMRDLAGTEVRRMLAECLEDVPDRQRLAFTLREGEGLSTEELCKTLEISPNNLGVLLFRARNRLRECLESKGVEGSADAELS
jgi:RNA polymerase sigma-70 factor (ECF subfamily)